MPGQQTPIRSQSSSRLWGGIIFPPLVFAIFPALICVSRPTETGWRYAISLIGVVLFCWLAPWVAAIPRIEELVKRKEFMTYTRPWLRAAITTTLLEILSAGLLLTVVVVVRKLGVVP